jgi:ankyrin repeat protein
MSPNCVIFIEKLNVENTLLQDAVSQIRYSDYPRRTKLLIRLLLENKADANLRYSVYRPTCLHFAAANG